MTTTNEGWVVLLRSKSARRGDTWLAVGDDLVGRYETVAHNGKAVIRHAEKMPERQATVYRDHREAKMQAAELEAGGAQVVVVPVQADGEKMAGREVEELGVAADVLWETKQQ